MLQSEESSEQKLQNSFKFYKVIPVRLHDSERWVLTIHTPHGVQRTEIKVLSFASDEIKLKVPQENITLKTTSFGQSLDYSQ